MTALTRRVVGVSAAMVAVILLASLFLTAIAQAQTTPTITSITASDITMTSATVTVNLPDANDGTTVYLKYGPVNDYPSTNPKPPAFNVYGEAYGVKGEEHRFVILDETAAPLQETSLSSAATFKLPASALPEADLPRWCPGLVVLL